MIRDLICKDAGFKNRLGTIGNKMIDTGGRILGNTSGFKNKLNKAVSKKGVNIRGYILTRVKF